MTDSDNDDRTELLRTDVLGRVKWTREQREAILDEYEASGLSGPKFARARGINYQTFATWRQRRQRDRGPSLRGGQSPRQHRRFSD